jgi:hypothetical protein
VQAFPSLQDVPFVFTGFEHKPVPGSHVPTSWHWSDAVQVTVSHSATASRKTSSSWIDHGFVTPGAAGWRTLM